MFGLHRSWKKTLRKRGRLSLYSTGWSAVGRTYHLSILICFPRFFLCISVSCAGIKFRHFLFFYISYYFSISFYSHLLIFLQKYSELKVELSRTERHILKEMGFVCHVEHPHKFISNYLATLETPPELRQEAWNLANDR